MRRVTVLLSLPLLDACEQEPKLTLAEQVKIIATECHELATQETGGFDPRTADEPPRTISKTTRRGGEVAGSGAIVRGAAGAAIGGLLGGLRRHRATNEPVTRTFANPDYEKYVAARKAFKKTFDQCMAERSGATE